MATTEELLESYPESQWSPALRAAVRWRRQPTWFERRWARRIQALEQRAESESPQWNARHYDDWTHDKLVWRILFLQNCSRSHSLESREIWRLAYVLAFVVGFAASVITCLAL